jgi:hypothetical protein
MSSTLEKKTPINTNIQRRRRSDEHQFATKKKKNTPINTKHTKKKMK